MKPLTLADAIEMDFPHALALMRASFWRVANHYDLLQTENLKLVVWVFVSRNGKFIEAKGATDAQALFHACMKANVPMRATGRCPRCDDYLEGSSDNNIECHRCHLFFHLGCWWTVACDEAHGHPEKCLILANVKQPPREEDVMLKQPEHMMEHRPRFWLVDFPAYENELLENKDLS